MKKSINVSISSGFLGLLTIVFVVLKLCHVIDWAWWIILLPLWLPVALVLLVLLLVCLWVKVSE